ncbi:MAG: proteasome subunit beta [Candidatus Geothermarchaeales archaeon]
MSQYVPGATIIGLKMQDGVLLVAEKRTAYGRFIVTRKTKKVFRITDKVGAACAGMTADVHEVVRRLRAIIKVKELKTQVPARVNSVAKLTSVILFQNRLYPLITQILIGGYNGGPGLYSLDPLGSVIEDNYITLGTGAAIAVGVLESRYKDGMTANEAKDLALDALKSAIGRDATSGDGADILFITKNGIEEESVLF